MSSALPRRSRPDGVNVTLGPSDSLSPLADKEFPCCLCGNPLEIRFTKKNKPYTTCLDCGIQTFFRGKRGIQHLTEVARPEILSAEKGSRTNSAILLFNRIERLQKNKKQLTERQGVIIRNPDLDNAIRVVENEIKSVQQELSELAGQKKEPGGY